MTRLAVWWTVLPLTAPVPPPGAPGAPGADRGEEFGKTSPIALVVILLLGLATVLLIRSMTKRLRNVPASFDPPEQDGASPDGSPDRPPQGGPPDGGGRRAPNGNGAVGRSDGPPGAGSP
jgi:hypothetical protein